MDLRTARAQSRSRATRFDSASTPAAKPLASVDPVAVPSAAAGHLERNTGIESLARQVQKCDAEIDALQIEMSKINLSWYRDTSVLIALAALLFSLGTTVLSYYRTQQQDIHDARAELRGFLQRLIALPSETDASASALNAENMLITNQAAEVMDRIPAYVSALEYILVANAFTSSNAYDRAEEMLKRALTISGNAEEEVAALRQYGALLFAAGKLDAGRDMYRKALEVNQKYPSNYPFYAAWTNAQTELHWASAEFMQRNRGAAKKHLAQARVLAVQLPYGSGTSNFLMQIAQAEQAVVNYNPHAPAGSLAVPVPTAPTEGSSTEQSPTEIGGDDEAGEEAAP